MPHGGGHGADNSYPLTYGRRGVMDTKARLAAFAGRSNTEELSSMFLGDQTAKIGQNRRSLRGLRQANITSIATQDERLGRRLRSAASSAAAQQTDAGVADFGSALADVTKRAKVRSRIVQQGDEAIKAQSLRDRVAVAKSGVQRQGDLLRAQGAAHNIQFGVNMGVQDARARAAASNAELFGTIGGATTRLLTDPVSRANAGNFFSNLFRPNNSVVPGQNGMLTPPPRTLPPGE